MSGVQLEKQANRQIATSEHKLGKKKRKPLEKAWLETEQDCWEKYNASNIQKRHSNDVYVEITKSHYGKSIWRTSLVPSDFLLRGY